MRSTLIATAAFAALLAGSSAVSAQSSMSGNEKFCAQMKGSGNAASPSCIYRTMSQCQEAVKNDQGTCIENPKLKKM